jgi:PEGA domain
MPDSTGRTESGVATNADDPLAEFSSEKTSPVLSPDKTSPVLSSEKTSPVLVVPPASVTVRSVMSDVAAPAERIQHSRVQPQAATHVPTRSRSSKRLVKLVQKFAASAGDMVPRLIEPVAAQLRTLRARATRTQMVVPANTTLVSFAGGTATGILVMWFAGTQLPSRVVPSAIPAVALETRAAATERSATAPDAEPAQADRAHSTPQPSSAVSNPVGTSDGRNDRVDQGARPSRANPAPSARRRSASASYRGSLAFLSAPRGARVFVNGALVGSTPLVLENLPVGSRAVRIEADGYQRWSASTQVVANQQTHVSATLARAAR